MPRSLRLLVFIWLVIALAACGNAAPAPTPLPPTNTPPPPATPLPPTPTPTLPPTATFTPTPGPLDGAATLVAAYAPTTRVNGGLEITLPGGEKVVLHEVENEKMEAQNWVENYNDWQVVAEGQDEQGRAWRVIENAERGETALAYAQETPLRMDAFPYWWWGMGPEGKAEITVPGNGKLEWLKITRTDEKDKAGHYVWKDEKGQPVKLSDMGYMYVEKIIPMQEKKPIPTEMKLPVVVITDWQVQALEAADGHEYVVREGKVLVDGKEVAVPETKSQVAPESLMFNTKDGQWYAGWQGIALWKVEHGRLVKYDRPVRVTDYWREDSYTSKFIQKYGHDSEVVGEIDYGRWGDKFKMGGEAVALTGMVGGISSQMWNGTAMYAFPGFLMKGESFRGKNSLYVLRLVNPFNDWLIDVYIEKADSVWEFPVEEGLEVSAPTRRINGFLKAELEEVPVLALLNNDGDKYMGATRYDGSRWMPREEALQLREAMEKALLAGDLGGDTSTQLGILVKLWVPKEVVGK